MRGTDGERTDQNHRPGPRSATHRLGGDRVGWRAAEMGGARGRGPVRRGAVQRTAVASVRGAGRDLRRPRLRGGGGGGGVREREPVLDPEAGPCACGGDAGAGQGGPAGRGIFAEPDQEGRGRGGPCRQEPDRLHGQTTAADRRRREGGCGRCVGRGHHPCPAEEASDPHPHRGGGGSRRPLGRRGGGGDPSRGARICPLHHPSGGPPPPFRFASPRKARGRIA